MQKKACYKSHKLTNLIIALILIFCMFPSQAFASTELDSTSETDVNVDLREIEDHSTKIHVQQENEQDTLTSKNTDTDITTKVNKENQLSNNLVPKKQIPESENTQSISSDYWTVSFDPDDGTTKYKDFHKIYVPFGGKITNKPDDPNRYGYIFKGWYSYLDQNSNPVLWNFNTDTLNVKGSISLWAAWEKYNDNSGSGNNGISNSKNSSGSNVDNENDNDVSGSSNINSQETPKEGDGLDYAPKTGYSGSSQVFNIALMIISLFILTVGLPNKDK